MFGFSSSPQSRLILLIGDEGILCALHDPLQAQPVFFAGTAEKEKSAAIFDFAVRQPRMPVTLLADNLAQDFRREALPRLNLFDRAKLVRRRLQQAFPQAPLAASLNVRGERGQVLLAGLHGGAALDWLNRLATAKPGNPPRLCLLPVECAALVAKLLPQAAEGWALLLSRQRTGGFRQIVTYRGELIFTRLTPPLPPDAAPAEIAETIARDIQASRGYLGRLGLTEAAPLHAVLLVPPALKDELRHARLPAEAPLLLSPRDAAHQLDLPFAPAADDPYGDALFAGWLAGRKRPRLALLPPDLRHARREVLIKRWGMRVAVAAFLLALGIAGWDASDLFTTLLAREKESAQLAALEKNLVHEQATAAPVTEPLGRLRLALERQRLFGAPVTMPWAGLRALDRGLGTQARLVKLEWQDDSGKPQDEVLRVDARLADAPDTADRQATVARFEQIAQNLARAMPAYAVSVTHYPFPALPQEALSNNAPADKIDSSDSSAEFVIKGTTP